MAMMPAIHRVIHAPYTPNALNPAETTALFIGQASERGHLMSQEDSWRCARPLRARGARLDHG
jgi:hypothetical protein